MIRREDVLKIGKFNKPHGVKGELSFSFLFPRSYFEDVENVFFICELDGILVPFRLEECRFTSGSAALIKLKTIDSENKARRLANRDVYFSKNQMPLPSCTDEIETWDFFIGFALTDAKTGETGIIRAIEDSTLNTLFIVEKNGKTLLVPAAEELITRIDAAGKEVFMQLPDGLWALES
jgi:16S rRNA processing protein RimM